MSEKLYIKTIFERNNFYTKTSLSYTYIRIQPEDKPVEHLINSYFKLLLLTLEKKTEATNAYLINNNKWEGMGSVTRTSSRKVREK